MSNLKKFGTFAGVFTPTILTIIGVILYLRLGWVVGSVGIVGAIAIIVLAHVATITTAFSMASMASNIKIGPGGFYALVSRSLGLEVGGAIGVPLYISQTLGVTLYIIGFSEIWTEMYPLHNAQLVSLAVLSILLIISYLGAGLAMKIQYFVMAIIVLSLISFFLSPDAFTVPLQFDMTKTKADHSFWLVFAVFFPAVTGIGAGAAMSGDLSNPKKSLTVGIISAVFVGFVVYIIVALYIAGVATQETLVNKKLIMVESSRWAVLVRAGIMGATLSSALGSLVGAPRILMATAEDKVVPFARQFAALSKKGEPRNAILLTGILVLAGLQIGSLDTVASLLTMFFLISYGMINLSVFTEKVIGISSFRPTFKVPLWVPFVGAVWCLVIMFMINALFAFISFVAITSLYVYYIRRGLQANFGDVRSAIFNAIGEWAVKTSRKLPQFKKSWKPNLLIPIENPQVPLDLISFIKALILPSGTIRLTAVNIEKIGVQEKINLYARKIFRKKKETMAEEEKFDTQLYEEMQELKSRFEAENIFSAATVVDSTNFIEGLSIVIQTMMDMFFPPNVIFFTMSKDPAKNNTLAQVIAISRREKLGVILLSHHAEKNFGQQEKVNVWLSSDRYTNLSMLMAIQIEKNWPKSKLTLITANVREEDLEQVQEFLNGIIETTRLKIHTQTLVLTGDFRTVLEDPPQADLQIFGIARDPDLNVLHEVTQKIDSTCMFVMDSGGESVDE